jgi:fumarylpyruvate hydrolase
MPLRTIDQAALVKSTDKSGNSRKMRASCRVLFCGYSIYSGSKQHCYQNMTGIMNESFVFPSQEPASLPIIGSERRFPVHRIYCVGRNYAAHAREMGGAPEREPPFFFAKPPDAAVTRDTIPYPLMTSNLHHEVELVVALAGGGVNIPAMDVISCIYGYAVGVDLTRRDLQAQAKSLRRPWDMGKSFDYSAPVSSVYPAVEFGHPCKGAIVLSVNGEERQRGDLADMIWTVAEIIIELSRYYRLCAGDLIFTGTPAGVGALHRGDRVACSIEDLGALAFRIDSE